MHVIPCSVSFNACLEDPGLGGAEDIVNQQVDGDTTTALALGGAAGGSVGVVVTAGTTKLPCG